MEVQKRALTLPLPQAGEEARVCSGDLTLLALESPRQSQRFGVLRPGAAVVDLDVGVEGVVVGHLGLERRGDGVGHREIHFIGQGHRTLLQRFEDSPKAGRS